jgi:hypothetical protein
MTAQMSLKSAIADWRSSMSPVGNSVVLFAGGHALPDN